MLKCGVIGLGIGEKIAQAISSNKHCQLKTLCDFNSSKLSDVASRFPGVSTTCQADEILEDPEIDLIVIASYDNFHFSQAVKAIGNNKHVFVEKPFVLDEDEAKIIKQYLKQYTNVKISSNLILRQSPRFADLKSRIQRNVLGEIYYMEADYNYGRLEKILSGWRGKIPNYSAVYGGGVHMVDLLMWLYEDDIVEVTAIGNKIMSKNTTFENLDMVVALLQFSKGAIGKMAVNFGCVYPHFHNVAVYGSKGTFVNGGDQALLYSSRNPSVPPDTLDTAYPGVHKGALVSSFVEEILGIGKAIVSEDDVFRSMDVCFAIEKSARDRRPVSVY